MAKGSEIVSVPSVPRTRTAAARGTLPERFTLALASCQHYEQGHYAAYRAIAADAPDLVVHVGDYIYEGRGQQGRVPCRFQFRRDH